jgi:hypothetical protein
MPLILEQKTVVMNISNINEVTEWFEVLQTTVKSQTAVMRLAPGEASGERAESHQESEQLLLLLEGACVLKSDPNVSR